MRFASTIWTLLLLASTVSAQSVSLPAPRLLTTMPMGGQAGTQVDVVITGETLEDVEQLVFSHPSITATAKLGDDGKPEPNTFVVTIAADAPLGIHTARVMTRLGISSPRVFTVGDMPEVVQTGNSVDVASAMPLSINSICNATLPVRAINHYSIAAKKGQRLIIDCAAKGIDSKMNPVLILADHQGNDLMVQRRGDVIDFTAPNDGTYIIKVHELTFQGGNHYFYRLSIREAASDAPVVRQPTTLAVNSFSWPPSGLTAHAALSEGEPNNDSTSIQKISLPCDIQGSFFPAADIDVYEFTAKQGETWWVEVASERLGRPTDPSVIVQQVVQEGDEQKLVDVAELTDIPSPVKRSSNGYAYDGPPYNAGSTDVLGKFEVKQDGTYRLQISDLFGGTREDSRNVYRLIVRQAEPDFALVAWAMHMELRNGDRNALSKPIALRGGSTMPFEVIAVRRDGFNGEIELTMENLPDGVTATGMKIAAGQTRGIMLVTADQDAPRGLSMANFFGTSELNGQQVVRPVHLATMAWPVTNAWAEIPEPRLVPTVPVSVGGSEYAAFTMAPVEAVVEAKVGQTVTIPMQHIRRGEFSGNVLGLRTFGAGFESIPKFEVSISDDQSSATVDLAKLKTAPGDYSIAFYGSVVAKHQHNPSAVIDAEESHSQAQAVVVELTQQYEAMKQQLATASTDEKENFTQQLASIDTQLKAATAAVEQAAKAVAEAKKIAQPKDIVDIVVSKPITLRVSAAEAN